MTLAIILGTIAISSYVVMKYFWNEEDEIEKEHKEARDFRKNEADKNR